jgi:uncharacterized phage-associated protein
MAKIYNIADFKGELSMKEISIFDVAKTFLHLESMTHKKLQKICYYAQAWHLALEGEPLFHERFEAWIHGPVCPELYDYYKTYGWTNIPVTKEVPHNITGKVYDFIKEIYRAYGQLDGEQLELLSHSEKPWQEARKGLKINEPSNETIKHTVMREYYLKLYEESQND